VATPTPWRLKASVQKEIENRKFKNNRKLLSLIIGLKIYLRSKCKFILIRAITKP
jgi:hypothetical protein